MHEVNEWMVFSKTDSFIGEKFAETSLDSSLQILKLTSATEAALVESIKFNQMSIKLIF